MRLNLLPVEEVLLFCHSPLHPVKIESGNSRVQRHLIQRDSYIYSLRCAELLTSIDEILIHRRQNIDIFLAKQHIDLHDEVA